MSMYAIKKDMYDGRDAWSERIGEYTEEEKDLFVNRLNELGYTDDSYEEVTRYYVRLPAPNDHHGNYYVTYIITKQPYEKPTPIGEAVGDILDPATWDRDTEDSETEDLEDDPEED